MVNGRIHLGHQVSVILLISQNASHFEHIEYVDKIVGPCNGKKIVFLLKNKHSSQCSELEAGHYH